MLHDYIKNLKLFLSCNQKDKNTYGIVKILRSKLKKKKKPQSIIILPIHFKCFGLWRKGFFPPQNMGRDI